MTVQPVKVLLIEDNPVDAELIKYALGDGQDPSIEIYRVDRLSAGLSRLTDIAGDAILLDLMLPDSEGLDTFRRIHSQAPSVPILVLSGIDDEPLALQAVQEGAQDYFVKKTITGSVLKRALRYAIERNRIQEELRQARDELELRVRERTAELTKSNESLRKEIADRLRAEDERRRLEVQIQHAQKLESLGVLAGGIAHDFNNLLTAILGNASLALMELSPESPCRVTIEEIEKVSLRAADLIRQLLAYSGKGRFVVGPLNLSRVVEEMAHLLHTVISKKAVLHCDFAPDLPAINADATQVRQVVMNLITNASDAIGDRSGVIALHTGLIFADQEYLRSTFVNEDLPEGDYLYLEVSDTGCGMDQATLERIFDPFFTTKFTGRGLGLAAVLGIVRGHRGTIKVSSEPGRGTTFKVLFPCTAGVESQPREGDLEESWRGTGTVLVVDDEESVRMAARRILERAGFRTLQAEDGREGVRVFRENAQQITAILLDLAMPHLSGEEAFREMRLLEPGVKVVLMSGYHEQEVTNLFAGMGLSGFVQKPFQARDLLTAFRRIQDR